MNPGPFLVCEGPCNPGIGALDAEIAEMRKQVVSSTRSAPPVTSAGLLNRLRTLIHTSHTMRSSSRATCNECGWERKYG